MTIYEIGMLVGIGMLMLGLMIYHYSMPSSTVDRDIARQELDYYDQNWQKRN